ncbi:exodeoxyribonuclease I [Methylovulum psychrotolerans]|uniref:exodeoxyribonuclease I n=1 Tax=Methylovulum psychrotolerans TaxID=1704499 RepID=UPI001BFF25D7|nr:exodeoxyribonuclease I [Methylovulum psychrotolerans]MBT9097016.1 exodeoxyribonuclease I [Methylovulum psychrotolerans]
MSSPTLYWHDYETFGADPQRDRPAQFAGVRTDNDFTIIDEPLVVYCQLAADSLPHPDACLITGITPQIAAKNGVREAEFIRLIHAQLARPHTCALGYNSIRFDDEVTRNSLYRHFYDPYAREWQHGNSRWDLLDVVRAAKALRPDGIQWPVDGLGKPSFRLEHLTAANGIGHANAHDALADVYATIAVAKLLKTKQPKLYQFFWQHRSKYEALNLLQLGRFVPLLHVSGMYPALRHCLAVIVPLCQHPGNTNGVVVYDLAVDPTPLLSLSVEEIRQRLFTATEALPEGTARIPLKTVHINKCPVLAPMSVLRPADRERLGVDLPQCQAHLAALQAAPDIAAKVAAVFAAVGDAPGVPADPDLALYSGGFFSDADKRQMAKIPTLPAETLAAARFPFADPRLPEMLFRYRARNYPHTLSATEAQAWRQSCVDRLTGRAGAGSLTFSAFFRQLESLRALPDTNADVLEALAAYAADKMQALGLAAD